MLKTIPHHDVATGASSTEALGDKVEVQIEFSGGDLHGVLQRRHGKWYLQLHDTGFNDSSREHALDETEFSEELELDDDKAGAIIHLFIGEASNAEMNDELYNIIGNSLDSIGFNHRPIP